MGRIRTIKPEIAKHEALFEAERATGFPMRFVWAVFPTVCDREGRFKWRAAALKTDLLPYDDVDFALVLEQFRLRGFLVKYRVGAEWFGLIPTFTTHQRVNARESESALPSVAGADEVCAADSAGFTREAPVDDSSPTLFDERITGRELEGKGTGKEGNGCSSEALRVSEPALLEFPVVGFGGPLWPLTQSLVTKWAAAFPSLNVLAEAHRALVWVQAKPGRRKTVRGMEPFLVGWLGRTNDRGGRDVVGVPSKLADNGLTHKTNDVLQGLGRRL